MAATLLLLAQLARTSTDGRCVFTRFLKAEASENTALFRVSISILKLRSSLHHQDKVATGIGLEHIGIYSRMEVCTYVFFFQFSKFILSLTHLVLSLDIKYIEV